MGSHVENVLGYSQSASYITAADLRDHVGSRHSHIYRKAYTSCGLQGAYFLDSQKAQTEIPIVFYCRADNEDTAQEIHRRIWNQNIVPFILVETLAFLRLYSGFRYNSKEGSEESRGILEASIEFNEIVERLSDFHAKSIDDGTIWDTRIRDVDSENRVDWTLLAALRELETRLRNEGLERAQAHALIGKFVYLRYLRDREILSNRKLERWHLTPESIFSRRATLKAFLEVNAKLDAWLNGSVFPIDYKSIQRDHLTLVAGVFSGDSPGGQLHLDFQAYDFSFIPIETLSAIYEQFLHAPENGASARGRREGAYYTSIPLVSYMLGELESRRPLKEGMKVLDPSCGSGAFLVQCYRELIEKKQRATSKGLRLGELRELLTAHIFGIDRDGDACRMAEMSLILTLLDYATQPDLESIPQFKLPNLRGNNIFQADFFASESDWAAFEKQIDWLVGNPPWIEAKRTHPKEEPALDWMTENAGTHPTGGNQVAEAFVWRSLPLLKEDAVAGLVLPVMTLFKKESTRFRAALFKTVKVWYAANFSNLAYALFAGRSKTPALSLFFSPRLRTPTLDALADERVTTFSPFVINQRANRKQGTWSIVVNGAEVKELSASALVTGDALEWKIAMWGCFMDRKLLGRVSRRFPSMQEFKEQNGLKIHQGFELREADGREPVQPMPELAGKKRLEFSRLKNCGRIFNFPSAAVSSIPPERAYVRKRGGMAGLKVSYPPHLIVDVGRRFAVYSDEFIAVPARQIGVSANKRDADLLRAMSLYLTSDFCTYHQFFVTPQWGVFKSIATLVALKELPIALANFSNQEIKDWADLHRELTSGPPGVVPPGSLLKEMNELVYKALGLREAEKVLVEDFVRWNIQMVQGKAVPELTAPPEDSASQQYLVTLKAELDDFVGDDSGMTHSIRGIRAAGSTMLSISMASGQARSPEIIDADHKTARALNRVRENLLKRHSQWVYFERCLQIYEKGAMYLFKPLEAIHWTRRQAILDAQEVIAKTLESQGR